MKRQILILLLAAALLLGGCRPNAEAPEAAEDKLIVVGISQVGAESDWRVANTESMKAVFTEENGYRLLFEDARQIQENQIRAVRRFIQQRVDYIIIMPLSETGWDSVLQEAKDAGIPVILADRTVDVEDDSLYTTTGLEKIIVKRVIACGEQTVDIDFEQGIVYVDDEPLTEDYVSALTTTPRSGGFDYPITIPEGYVFVLGDNRPVSKDSRYPDVGLVHESAIMGKVLLRTSPLSDFGLV